ncbi:MAG: hypothetical protein ACAI38_21910 [Myxococcota bacterium]
MMHASKPAHSSFEVHEQLLALQTHTPSMQASKVWQGNSDDAYMQAPLAGSQVPMVS